MIESNIETLLDSNPNNVIDDEHLIENEIPEKELKDTRSKSWFLMLANPQLIYLNEQGESLSPEDICKAVVDAWCGNDESRSCLVAYCISAKGFIHLHLCVCSKDAERFSAIKKAFPKANIRPTKGTKADVENYIYKRGKWEEKGEVIVCTSQKGEVKGRQGQRSDINNIRDLVNAGYTPQQIFNSNINYRRYEKLVKDEYFDKKRSSIPLLRDVEVYWHVGESGCGKSYEAVKLCEKYGRDNVYIINCYDSGKFDKYNGEDILFLDEFKGGITFQELLTILDRYSNQVHCRYSNSYMLWKEVHITSVFPPEVVYNMLVTSNFNHDSYEQLIRRINYIVYHYKVDEEFCSFKIPRSEYFSYEDLKDAVKALDETDLSDCPFEQLALAL